MSFWSPRPAGPTAQDRRQGSLQAPGSSALTLAPLQSLLLALPGCSEGLWRGGGHCPGQVPTLPQGKAQSCAACQEFSNIPSHSHSRTDRKVR